MILASFLVFPLGHFKHRAHGIVHTAEFAHEHPSGLLIALKPELEPRFWAWALAEDFVLSCGPFDPKRALRFC